ncbi:acid protease [Aureobasidium pullulans]|nr:acid protease [Aureobasidium pullulans]
MRLLVLFAITTFSVVVRSQATNDPVAPLSIPPSTYWDGADGRWSTFHVEVGGQTVRLLPSTSASAGSSTWVVIDEGCTVANPNLTNCNNERGYLFHRNESTSWSTRRLSGEGLYSLNTFVEGYLGLTGNAYYGFDTINLGLTGSGLPTVQGQVIAGFGTNDFWLGNLGLSPYPFNFTDLDDPQPSLLSTLQNQSLIPSLSWAYTAGAQYKTPPVLGSLTLGGYDTTRFTPNNVSFPFGADFSRDLLVKLRSISYDTFGSPPLLASEIDIFLDSAVTQMWLPVGVCQQFEKAFNLTWNATAELYLLDEDTHSALLSRNPTFTFTIANGSNSADGTVDIVFPYSAFDLNITQPYVNTETRYFPLKQAQNSSQFVLGRVFLQEAYLVTDYGHRNFSVSQALFPQTNIEQNIVTIRTPGYKAEDDRPDGLSGGAIAGTVVAAVVVLVSIIAATIWLKRRSTRNVKISTEQTRHDTDEKDDAAAQGISELDHGDTAVQEVDGWHGYKPELEVNDGSSGRHELPTPVKVHEVAGHLPIELEAPLR